MASQAIKDFIDSQKNTLAAKPAPEQETYIHVDEIAAKVAKFYEKARNLIDYQEEHLLRKGAIERALQQGLIFRGTEDKIAEALIKKIIRAGHLPNDQIPERKIQDVQHIIDNLLILLDFTRENSEIGGSEKSRVSEWLIQITSSAIEEELDPPLKDRLIADLMFQSLRARLAVSGATLSQNDRDLQLFIGVQRALLKADLDQLHFRLLKFSYPNWNSMPEADLTQVAKDLPVLKKNIDLYLKHPNGPAFFKLCNHYNTVFYLLRDVAFENNYTPEDLRGIFEDDEQLSLQVKDAYTSRYKKAKRALARLAVFSVISIFFSKILIALAIEIPIDKYLTGDYSNINTIINIIVPPALMLLILSFIRLPSKKNWGLIMKETRAVIHEKNGSKEIVLTIPKKRKIIPQTASQLLYFAASVLILYTASKFLYGIGFSVANVVIFLLFTSLVAATGIKVHNRSKDLSLEKEKHSFLSFIFDVLIMPFVTIGKWLLAGLAKFKPLVIIINFVDLPFNVFVNFIENLRNFIRSKKEELY